MMRKTDKAAGRIGARKRDTAMHERDAAVREQDAAVRERGAVVASSRERRAAG